MSPGKFGEPEGLIDNKERKIEMWNKIYPMGVALALTFSASAVAEEWKMHAVWNEARPEAQLVQRWAKAVTNHAGTELSIKVFPGGQLGIKDVDMLRILPQGNVIQAAALWPGYMSRDEPAYANLLPLGVVPSVDSYLALIPDLAEMYRSTYEKYDIAFLGTFTPPVREATIFCREPVNDLTTLRTKKLRVWDKTLIDTFAELGVAAQIIPQNDLYLAMQTGVVDCAIYAAAYAVSVSLNEVAPYASYITPFIVHPVTLITPGKAWRSLSPEMQKLLKQETEAISREAQKMLTTGSWESEKLAKLGEAGVTVLPPFPEADQAAFTEAARTVWRRLSSQAGDQAVAWQKQLEDRMKSVN